MPITYLDEEEETFVSPLQKSTLRQTPRRKITYLDEEVSSQQFGQLPPIEEMFKPKPKPEGFFRQTADIPVGLGKGVAQGVRMFTDILGADNPVSQSIRGVEDYLGNLMSAQAKNDQAEIARIMEEAQDKGVLDQVLAGVKAFSVAPVDLTVQALGTMAPVIAGGLAANTAKLVATGIRGGAAAARGLTAGQMAATQAGIGAGMGAGVVKGTIYDEVKNELVSQGISEDAAHQQAVKAQEYGGKNLDQILLGAGLGAFAATTGAEKIIGGILTKTGVGASKSRITNALKTGVTEAFPEAAQGAQEQLAANIALQREGMDVPTTRGVFSSGALEGIAGFGVGAPLGAIQKASVAEDAARKAEEADAPATAEALRKTAQEGVQEEKDISATNQAIEEIEKETKPTVPIGEEYTLPSRDEFKESFAKLTPESLAETEARFQEALQDEGEDADTRAFAQTALDALAEFRAEKAATQPPAAAAQPPTRKAELPTDVLPTETPGATYGREAEIYDVFAGVRQRPMPPSGPAFESAQVIEQEIARAEKLRQSPEGREQLRRELQGEEMTGDVRRAVEQALATTPEVAEEGDVFAKVAAPAEVETAASLSRVADNTATDEEIFRLARQGLVNIQDGQNVITPRGEEVMQRGGAPLPRLTPEERAAEIAAEPAAIVEQEVAPAAMEEVTPTVSEASNVPKLESEYNAAKAKLDALGPEPIKPSSEARFFGARGRAGAPTELVARYDADVKAYNSYRRKYSSAKKAEVEAANNLFYARREATSTPSATTAVTTPPVTEAVTPAPAPTEVVAPAPVEPTAAAPVGIAVGNRVKTKTTPQSFVVEEVLPQSAREAELGEQYYTIRNERTGETQTVEANDIRAIKGKGGRRMEVGPAANIRVEEDSIVVPNADRYTFEEAGLAAIEFFNEKAPDGLVIVNDSTDPEYRFKASYDPNTGDITLNRAFIRKGESISDILAHELGHYIYSDPRFQKAFQGFWDAMTDEEKAEGDRIINQLYNKNSKEVQIEEKKVRAFMELVQEARLKPKWEQILNAIKQWLNDKFGTTFNVTDRGALSVLAVAHKRFRKGEIISREMSEGALRMAAEPTAEAAPAERAKPRTKMQNIIDISTGVKRPRTKLKVDEVAALKDQIRIGARKRREDKQTQVEFAKDVTQYLREMTIRGKVRPAQLRAITGKAMRTQFDNEASIKGFLNYANKVIENANYDKDIAEAKTAIKQAKRLAKQKGLAGNIKANLEKLANIDPRQIEPEEMIEVDGEMPVSVAEFTAVLKEYMKAGGPVTAEGYILVPDAEITDFLTKIGEQIETNRKATENLGLDGELADIADKTPEQIDEELARNEERRNRIEEKVNKLAEDAQIGLVKYSNPEMTSEEKLVLDDMKRITLSDISIGERKEFVKVANNILVNNKFLGAQKFASIAKGQIGAVEAAKDSKTVKRNSATLKVYENLFGENFGRLVNLGTQSFSDTFRNLTGTKDLPRLLYQMGFGEIERGQANTNRARREITDGVQNRFRQIEKETGQKISNTQGVYSMGVAGNLIQIHPDETQAEGIQRMRGLIKADIEKKKKSPKSEDRKAAIYIQKALDEVDSDTVDGVLENLRRLHPANYEAITFLMNEVLPEHKPMLKEHDELFNNQTENYENPYYLPIRYRSIGTEPKKPGELRGRASDGVTAPKQAPNSIKRIKNTVLPEGKQIDYNLTRNVLDSLSTQLEAAYTNPGWQQVYAFLKTPEAVEALGGVENYDFVTKRINNLSDSRERRIYQMDPFNQAADLVANMVRKIGTSIALGGVGQAAKQMPDQVATTMANVNDLGITTMAWTEMKAALPIMRQFSIGERGEIAGGSKWVNQLEGNFTKLQQFMQDGMWPKAMEAFENINNFWLIPLKISDTAAASHGWISYYKKYLKDNNIPFTNWDNEAQLAASGERGRVEAGLYADSMIDLYQGSSDPTKMATFAQRGDSGGGNLLKTMIMPFSSFVIQQRSRILSDLRDISYGNADEKAVSAKGLAGTLLGIVIFHGIRRYGLPLITGGVAAGVYGLLGVDMEEPDEEEKAEKEKRVFRQFLGEVASNIFVGGYSAYAETRLIDAVNATAYFYEIQTQSENVLDDKGEVMSWDKYRRERAPMYRYTGPGADSTLGMLDILPSQTRETFDRLKDLRDDEIMDSLTEEEQRVLVLAATSELLYTMRLNDADVARMVKRMAKEVKDQAKAREAANKKLQQLFR